jgi:hypothetical protein
MLRRVIGKTSQIDVTREANARTTRTLLGGSVLNILQSVRPGVARFTVEGEGAEIWFCDQALIDTHTLHVSATHEG